MLYGRALPEDEGCVQLRPALGELAVQLGLLVGSGGLGRGLGDGLGVADGSGGGDGGAAAAGDRGACGENSFLVMYYW